MLLCVALAGCGVPRLYSAGDTGAYRESPTPADPKRDLAPKVQHIIDEISCELADVHKYQLGGKSYLITVLLTLQVDDNLDVTPSVSLVRSLLGGTESETTTLSADVGGGRRRTFTTTYYLESDKLPDGCKPTGGDRLLRLDGNLGLFEVARDGAGVIAQGPAVHQIKPGKDDKAVSTFGSLIQFTVTRGVTGLGPVWTLKRFKGPSGQNGLVNGKRLNTDSVALTFAPVATAAETAKANADVAGAVAVKDEKHRNTVAAAAERDRQQRARDLILRLNPTGKRQPGKMSFDDADAFAKAADAQLAAAAEAEAEADAAVRAAVARREALSDTATATYAGQTLLNTILLQNLNLQPR